MAGIGNEEPGVGRSLEGISSGQRCQSGEVSAEWRSSGQVENGITSTSPPYWDSDDDEEGGAKPSELYGKHTWKIEKFSQINKRELRSTVFEVGGYKWYILIYPQGCDVCNHLSLFLCVANHDKLLPGWSHFAQFTIAVVNKDPKKSKYSDTVHRFWKKEHDWGWKKFMELSKVLDGFIDADTLIIKAQVQVIREKADRPFRCLDCQYRRELLRVYFSDVEQICRNFVQDRRGKLGKLIEDKTRWSSFCAFWLGMDQNARRRMSREKADVILKVVVKHFFIEKEVTSTLVMDSLYSGLRALEGQSKCKKGRLKLLDAEEMPAPIVCVEKDVFVLVDDVLLLLERAAVEPLPPKDEKGPQNRTKDGGSGEDFNKDSIERDERRLTELGRRTVETFVLAHIFSNKIEAAYQEAVALKRQEELIREEEEAWLAESEQKAKRGVTEKEKKSKKKQAKQKRNNRKGKDKGRDDRSCATVPDKREQESASDEMKDLMMEQAQPVLEKPDLLDDGSDVSDSVGFVAETLQPDSEERDTSPVNWDTDASEVHPPTEASGSGISGLSSVQNGIVEKKSSSVMDDSSSTCSTDSVPSVVMNGPYKGSSFPSNKSQKSPSRGKSQQGKLARDGPSWVNETDNQPSGPVTDAGDLNDSGSSKAAESEAEAVTFLHDRIKWLEHVVKKEEEVVLLQKKLGSKDQVEVERPSKEKIAAVPSSPRSPPRKFPSAVQLKLESRSIPVAEPVPVKKSSSRSPQRTDKSAHLTASQVLAASRPDSQKVTHSKPAEKSTTAPQVSAMSRPSSAPLIPGSRPPAPVVSVVQTTPLLARSVSAAGRLGPDPSPATQSFVPQSYRNAMMGSNGAPSPAGFTHPQSPGSAANPSPAYSQPPALVPAAVFVPQSSERIEPNTVKPAFSFGHVNRDVAQNGHQWIESPQKDANRGMPSDASSILNDFHKFDLYKPVHSGSREQISMESPAGTSGRQTQGLLADEFPHLDIINDLLDDEHSIMKVARASSVFQGPGGGAHHLNRQYSFPGDMGISDDVGSSSTSPCRFERTVSYIDDGFQRGYSSSGNHFNSFRDFIPQGNPLPYANGQIDGLIPNQWQVPSSDLSLVGMRNTDGDCYPYHVPEYPNMACGVNGFTVYRPSNGH
ncbi:TNF receptor-associated factor homolog 1a [Malania oleifera]|uniref:TNF receptor-associated factor homolog 1a n=1 Tax=Malania oleifera TaxID=397392 RepID=UPI0025AE1D0E|nr:TNF receptor-associated factor homolog 1a [Malania oleifera]